jgi:hypothetical protein
MNKLLSQIVYTIVIFGLSYLTITKYLDPDLQGGMQYFVFLTVVNLVVLVSIFVNEYYNHTISQQGLLIGGAVSLLLVLSLYVIRFSGALPPVAGIGVLVIVNIVPVLYGVFQIGRIIKIAVSNE